MHRDEMNKRINMQQEVRELLKIVIDDIQKLNDHKNKWCNEFIKKYLPLYSDALWIKFEDIREKQCKDCLHEQGSLFEKIEYCEAKRMRNVMKKKLDTRKYFYWEMIFVRKFDSVLIEKYILKKCRAFVSQIDDEYGDEYSDEIAKCDEWIKMTHDEVSELIESNNKLINYPGLWAIVGEFRDYADKKNKHLDIEKKAVNLSKNLPYLYNKWKDAVGDENTDVNHLKNLYLWHCHLSMTAYDILRTIDVVSNEILSLEKSRARLERLLEAN